MDSAVVHNNKVVVGVGWRRASQGVASHKRANKKSRRLHLQLESPACRASLVVEKCTETTKATSTPRVTPTSPGGTRNVLRGDTLSIRRAAALLSPAAHLAVDRVRGMDMITATVMDTDMIMDMDTDMIMDMDTDIAMDMIMDMDTDIAMDMIMDMAMIMDTDMDTDMIMDMDMVVIVMASTSTSMATSMASATKKERTVTGHPAAPAAATPTRPNQSRWRRKCDVAAKHLKRTRVRFTILCLLLCYP